jgi:hypothetical protein
MKIIGNILDIEQAYLPNDTQGRPQDFLQGFQVATYGS